MIRLVSSVLILVALTACSGDDGGSEAGDGTGTETGGEVEGLEDHGTVRVQITTSDGDTSLFEGTASAVVTVSYLDCFQGFYTGSGAAWKQGGVLGAAVFEAFGAMLCTGFDGAPACSVSAITSTVDSDANDFELAVTYTIDDVATLEGAEFAVGPLPTEDLAGCEPVVEVRSMGVSGLDGAGNQIWRLGTISGTNQAKTDDVLPVQVVVVSQ